MTTSFGNLPEPQDDSRFRSIWFWSFMALAGFCLFKAMPPAWFAQDATASPTLEASCTDATALDPRQRERQGASRRFLPTSLNTQELVANANPLTGSGTPSYTLKGIVDFQEGDQVLAFNHDTGKVETRRVTDVIHRVSDHLRILEFEAEDGTTQTIKTTNEHPFWLIEEQSYVEAKNLKLGQRVRGPTGQPQRLTASTHEPHPEGIPVYNVTVEGLHNYFVTASDSDATPILSHNADCDNVPPRVYRSGSSTPRQMTPRPRDRDGLSASIDTDRIGRPGDRVQVIDPARLNNLEVVVDNPRTGHVSIRPRDRSRMQEWIESRELDATHEFTQELMDAIVE
jgi:hypothetical protein